MISNQFLEKYEIKRPDYEYINRGGIQYNELKPTRFSSNNGVWTANSQDSEDVNIMFCGDITCFQNQILEYRNNDSYDFFPEFREVEKLFKKADLVVGNLETCIFPEAPYRSERMVSEQNYYCNAPVAFLDAVKRSGIDFVTTSNNHDLDTGTVGIGETIDYLDLFGLLHTGTFKTVGDRFELIEINGIKIAIVAFTTDHNNKLCNLTKEGQEFLVNTFDEKKAIDIYNNAKNRGADVVIVSIHWGKELSTVQNENQMAIGRILATIGYDCIIGSHPHVLQPYDEIKIGNRVVPIFYSLGNFVSHNHNNSRARSAVACVRVSKTGDVSSVYCSYIPVITCDVLDGNRYVVLPLRENTLYDKNKRILKNITGILGDKIRINEEYSIEDRIEEKGKIENKSDECMEKAETGDSGDIIKSNVIYKKTDNNYVVSGSMSGISATNLEIKGTIDGKIVTEIVQSAFSNNDVIRKVVVGRNIKKIGKRAFKNNVKLEGFRLPRTVEVIEDEAFMGCVLLTGVVIPNSVLSIKKKAFSNCDNLMSVKIPFSVTEIADDVFEGSRKLTIYAEKDSYAEWYASNHNIPFVKMNFTIGKEVDNDLEMPQEDVINPSSLSDNIHLLRDNEGIDLEIMEIENVFKKIDDLSSLEDIKNFKKSYSATEISRLFWENHAIAVNEDNPSILRQKAKAKCEYLCHITNSYIPCVKSINQFSAPFGFYNIFITSYAVVGKGCTIFPNAVIGCNTTPNSKGEGFPIIGNNVLIGSNSSVIGNVSVGNNSRIGANCVVTKDVPNDTVVVLNGTRMIKKTALRNGFISSSSLAEKNPKLKDRGLSIISPYSSKEYIEHNCAEEQDFPNTVLKTCSLLGKPMLEKSNNPSEVVDFNYLFDQGINNIYEELKKLGIRIDLAEANNLFEQFNKKYRGQLQLDYSQTNCIVWFFDWMLFAYDRGYSNNDYFDFEFYKKSFTQRESFIGQGYRRTIGRIANHKYPERHIFINKASFNLTFSEFVHRSWFDINKCSFEEFSTFVNQNDKFFVKPVGGTGGSGARVISSDSDSAENLYKLCKENSYIVEQVIDQHPELAKFNDTTTNTVRVYSLRDANNNVVITMAAARFGRKGKFADNFHQGGYGVIVDKNTGVLTTDGINQAHVTSEYHPDSKEKFKGFAFPEWDKIISSVKKAALLVPKIRHVGWDITVTSDGEIEFIEGNSLANIDLPQMDQIGKRNEYENILKELARKEGVKFPDSEIWNL